MDKIPNRLKLNDKQKKILKIFLEKMDNEMCIREFDDNGKPVLLKDLDIEEQLKLTTYVTLSILRGIFYITWKDRNGLKDYLCLNKEVFEIIKDQLNLK